MNKFWITLVVVMAAILQGCCIGFSGDRAIKLDLNILGNTIKWESTVKGEYTPPIGNTTVE